MKVTHIITDLDLGGAEMALKNMVEYSQRRGVFHNKVISLTGIGPVGEMLQSAGIEVTALHLCGLLDIPRVIWQLAKLLKQQNSDIIQTWLYHADLLGSIAARLAGKKKIVWGIHNADLVPGKEIARSTYMIMRTCAALSYFLPQVVVCVSASALAAHIKFGYCAKKLRLIANGCNADNYDLGAACKTEMRDLLSIPPAAVVIGSVARFHEAKDHHNFVSAAAILANGNKKVYFLMVGKNIDSDNALLMYWINDSGFRERFILLGARHDVNKCFAAMDVFCLHSKNEALPTVVIEAMCSGLPCVVTDVGDCASMVADGGVVVPAENPQALAEVLRKVIALPAEEQAALGQKLRKKAGDTYSLSSSVAQYDALYQS